MLVDQPISGRHIDDQPQGDHRETCAIGKSPKHVRLLRKKHDLKQSMTCAFYASLNDGLRVLPLLHLDMGFEMALTSAQVLKKTCVAKAKSAFPVSVFAQKSVL